MKIKVKKFKTPTSKWDYTFEKKGNIGTDEGGGNALTDINFRSGNGEGEGADDGE
jgi:hypothetical protein